MNHRKASLVVNKNNDLIFRRSNKQLAETLAGHSVRCAVVVQHVPPTDAQLGLQAARLIVEPAMNDSTVFRAVLGALIPEKRTGFRVTAEGLADACLAPQISKAALKRL